MAAPTVVQVNSVNYVAVPQGRDQRVVRRLRNEDFISQFSGEGIRSPSTFFGYQTLIFPNFSLGLGRERIDSDSAREPGEYRRFWSATADTRFASGTYLPILEEASIDGEEVIRTSFEAGGELWGVWENDSSTDVVLRKYDAGADPTWVTGSNVLANSTTKIALDAIFHKDYSIVLIAQENDHLIYRASMSDVAGGSAHAAATAQPSANLLSDNVTANEDGDFGLLAEIGGEAVAAIRSETGGNISFFSSSNKGDNWVSEITISSGHGPLGLAVMAGIDNEDKLYVGTFEGLYEVDTSPSTWTSRLIFPMVGSIHNCRRMGVMHDGALWFAQGVDDSTPPIVFRMFVSNGARVIERVPNDFSLGDGVPDESLGPIRWMIAANGMVYASAGGGAASRNARVWCHNGKGWHSMRRHGTADQKIEWIAASSEDDGVPRLHYSARTGTAVSATKFLQQAFVNPASGVTIKRETTGYVDLPYVDLSFPLDAKNWLRVGVNADTLTSGTTNQHMNIDYGITSDLGSLTARNSSDLGNIVSGTSRLSFGSNGIGASGNVLGLRANILLGSATNTVKPVLKDIQVDAIPKPAKTRRFEILVDIGASAALRGGENATAAVYSDLEALEDLAVKAAMTYADIGTKYCNVEAVNYDDEIMGHENTGGPDSNARRNGTAQVILSEVAE